MRLSFTGVAEKPPFSTFEAGDDNMGTSWKHLMALAVGCSVYLASRNFCT
jgi:hypothetical protein